MARIRKQQDPPKGSPLWMTTYSDMVTLLLTFFVLLFSFSNLDAVKWQQLIASVKGSLGVMDGGTTLNEHELVKEGEMLSNYRQILVPEEMYESFERLQEEFEHLEALKEEISQTLAKLDERIVVETDERGIVIRFQDKVLFERAKANLRSEAGDLLIQVSSILKELENPIRIEGHTDDLYINTLQFPSNWELSTSRATNVLRFLIEQEIPPERLSAVGYGEYHPLVPNVDEFNRQQNRRVDIVLLHKSVSIEKAMLGKEEAHG